MLVIWVFPLPPVPISFFLMLIVTNILATLASTVQFVGMSAFHTQISDPFIGGTYMTLLNTISNLGGTWPRFFVLRAVDYFTIATCDIGSSSKENPLSSITECVSDAGKTACKEAGGTCVIERDGYYITSAACVTIGIILLTTFIWPSAKRLQSLPASKWRIS
ncbi:hypothetical protein FRC03_012348 [Tulasnella sp. 419]|nr:hypothetical protein FRC03_012348 [Tulasnella sp. 419]